MALTDFERMGTSMGKSRFDSSLFVRRLGYLFLFSAVVLYIFGADRLKLCCGRRGYIFEKELLTTVFSGTGIFLSVIGTCGAVRESYEIIFSLYSVLIVLFSMVGRIGNETFLILSVIFVAAQMVFIYRYEHGQSGETG